MMEAHKWKRVKLCETSLKLFAVTYFNHYFYTGFSSMHLELFDTIEKAIVSNNIERIVRAAPRGNAKSTIISFVTVMWCAIYAKKHYSLLISDTSSQADAFLMAIKAELEENELLINDFGKMYGEVWNASDIVLSNDCRVQALGVGKRVRGRRYKQYRPDLIICDDMENDENVMSVDQRKKNKDWFSKALSKAGDERTDIIVIGTIIHYDSLLANLLKNPIYDSKIYRAVIKFSNSNKWDTWEAMITDLSNLNHIRDAENFYKDNIEEMLKDTQVLWAEKEDYYNLMLQKITDGPAAFSSEKQNEPLSEDDRTFLMEWIQYYDDADIVGKELYTAGFVDPSLGKQGGDYSAIVTGGQDSTGQIYVLDFDMQRRHPDLIIGDVISKHHKYRYKKFGVETNFFQEYFKDTLKKALKEENRNSKTKFHINIIGVTQHRDKILRIQSLQPDIKSGRIKFRRSQQDLIEQLVNFPSAAHDDGPDALHGMVNLLSKKSALAEYYKELANENTETNLQSYLQNPSLQRINN